MSGRSTEACCLNFHEIFDTRRGEGKYRVIEALLASRWREVAGELKSIIGFTICFSVLLVKGRCNF
jgi:hypothetical protein